MGHCCSTITQQFPIFIVTRYVKPGLNIFSDWWTSTFWGRWSRSRLTLRRFFYWLRRRWSRSRSCLLRSWPRSGLLWLSCHGWGWIWWWATRWWWWWWWWWGRFLCRPADTSIRWFVRCTCRYYVENSGIAIYLVVFKLPYPNNLAFHRRFALSWCNLQNGIGIHSADW